MKPNAVGPLVTSVHVIDKFYNCCIVSFRRSTCCGLQMVLVWAGSMVWAYLTGLVYCGLSMCDVAHWKGDFLYMVVFFRVTFYSFKVFLSFKMTPYSLKLTTQVSFSAWNSYCFLYFLLCVFTFFLKTSYTTKSPFDILRHIFSFTSVLNDLKLSWRIVSRIDSHIISMVNNIWSHCPTSVMSDRVWAVIISILLALW